MTNLKTVASIHDLPYTELLDFSFLNGNQMEYNIIQHNNCEWYVKDTNINKLVRDFNEHVLSQSENELSDRIKLEIKQKLRRLEDVGYADFDQIREICNSIIEKIDCHYCLEQGKETL